MKRIEVINDKLMVEIKKTIKETVVSIIFDQTKTFLANLSKDAYDFIKVAFNKDYIVIYTEITLNITNNSNYTAICKKDNQTVKAVYDIKNKVVLDLSEKTDFNSQRKSMLNYMFIEKIPATMSMVLNVINQNNSQLLDDDIKYFRECLTHNNEDIPQEQIVLHILNKYPQLANYTNLNTPVSEELSEEISKKLGIKLLWFHIISQQIPLSKKEKLFNELREYLDSAYDDDIPTTCLFPDFHKTRKKKK